MDDVDSVDERAHFLDVVSAMRSYASWCEPELRRRAAAAASLAPSLSALLPPGALSSRLAATRAAVRTNQDVLDWVVSLGVGDDNLDGDGGDDGESSSLGALVLGNTGSAAACALKPPSPAQAAKVRSVLVQVAREWSAEGAAERGASFGVALRLLRAHAPRAPPNTQRVLLPGCGTGRLVLEVAAAGWVAVGCDVSYGMLLAGQAVLNSGCAPRSRLVHPWAMQASNCVGGGDAARGLAFPDVHPPAVLAANPGSQMSIAAGDWADAFAAPQHAGEFAAVVTCYALDTASNPLHTVALVARLLQPGGAWVHVGPLQWHWARGAEGDDEGGGDERHARSLELTWEELLLAVQGAGLQVLEEGACDPAPYGGDARSMCTQLYTARYFAARRSAE